MNNSLTMTITCVLLKLLVINSSKHFIIYYATRLTHLKKNQFLIRMYLTSSIFLRLQAISGYPGHVNIMSLFIYTMRKVWQQQIQIGLSLYDCTGQGFLRQLVFFIHFSNK